ncbi:universal stress protein [Lysobacter niabensis]|uniref:universal stress protein n=1 Tax=Agrilutibacter niabensis TaxID=380628 RepID=UPI00360F95D9
MSLWWHCDSSASQCETDVMFPKDLVVFLEPHPGHSQRLAFAASLAKRWQAHLIATFVTQPLALNPHAGFAVGTALSEMLAEYQTGTAAALAQARAEFDHLADRRSFTSEWRVSDNETGELLMLHARHASLAILGPPASQSTAATTLSLSERMIFASGRPCLLVPTEWSAERIGGRIVVGWNGGREATRAIADAMPLLTAAETVHLVVVPDARIHALYGEDPGADMATHLARQGVPVVLERCPGDDAGAVLLDRCAADGADMLVIGAMGRSRISEFVLGGATRTILDHVRVPVLLSR